MNKTEYLLSMLMELPPKFEMIEKELQANEYTTEEVTLAACKFADSCFCECRDFEYEHKKKPEKEEVHSSYIYEICELLLKYGLDPNLVLEENFHKTNIMYEIYWIDNHYVSADTMRLLLENGGNPYLEFEYESLFHMVNFDVSFDITEGYYESDWDLCDRRIHFWFVMRGFIAEKEDPENEFEKDLKNHEKYSHSIKKKDNGYYDLYVLKKKKD